MLNRTTRKCWWAADDEIRLDLGNLAGGVLVLQLHDQSVVLVRLIPRNSDAYRDSDRTLRGWAADTDISPVIGPSTTRDIEKAIDGFGVVRCEQDLDL